VAASSAGAASLASAAAAASGSLVCDSPDLFVQVLPSNVFRNVRLIQRAMLLTVRHAKHRILITNPYFFPPPVLFRALQDAAQRGVEVVVICPGEGRTDVPVTRWASQHIYYTLLRSGVRIFEMQSATLHAKTVTIDGIYTSIGSFNWDRSVRNSPLLLSQPSPSRSRLAPFLTSDSFFSAFVFLFPCSVSPLVATWR
jgi:phosphatidylserine/phosphatidylglycerophosphate/cardiolipin synthase-like enzyme